MQNQPNKIHTPKTRPALRRPQVLLFTQDTTANRLLQGLLSFSRRYGANFHKWRYDPHPNPTYPGQNRPVKVSDEEAQVAFEQASRRDLTAHLAHAPTMYASMKQTIAIARAEAEELKRRAAKSHIAPEHLPLVFGHSQRSDVVKMTYRWPLAGEELEHFIAHTGPSQGNSGRLGRQYVRFVDSKGVQRKQHLRLVNPEWDHPHSHMEAICLQANADGGMDETPVCVAPWNLSLEDDALYRAGARVVAFSPSGNPQSGSYGQQVQHRDCVKTLQQWLDRIDWCEWLLEGDGGLEANGKREHALRQVRHLARQARIEERSYTQYKGARERLTEDWFRKQQHQADLRMGEAHNVMTLTRQRLAEAIKEAEAMCDFEAVQAASCLGVDA